VHRFGGIRLASVRRDRKRREKDGLRILWIVSWIKAALKEFEGFPGIGLSLRPD
jgi:hypothetical protein